MAHTFRLTALALAAALALPAAPAVAQRWDRGGWQGDRGRNDGWRGDRGWRGGGRGPGYYRGGNNVAPLVGGALLGLGLGAVLGGALAPAPGYAGPPPGYAAPPPHYAPPPPAYYAPGKPGPGYDGY